jgi:8-oxo-dGTP diphosphatase
MPLARFVAFHEVPTPSSPGVPAPVFAVVLAQGPAGFVLVHNRYRQVWELPGGFIDAGETPHDSARRELKEEAGCAAEALECLGIVEVDDGRRHHGAVFRCRVVSVPASINNEEIDGICAWRPGAAPEPLGSSDRALLERFGHTGPSIGQ